MKDYRQTWKDFFNKNNDGVILLEGSSKEPSKASLTIIMKDPNLPVWRATRVRGLTYTEFVNKAGVNGLPAFGYEDSYIMASEYKDYLPVIVGDTTGIETADICLYVWIICK